MPWYRSAGRPTGIGVTTRKEITTPLSLGKFCENPSDTHISLESWVTLLCSATMSRSRLLLDLLERSYENSLQVLPYPQYRL